MKVAQVPKNNPYTVKYPDYDKLMSLAVDFQSFYALDHSFTPDHADNSIDYRYWVLYLLKKNLHKEWLSFLQMLGEEFHPYLEVAV